MTTFQFEGLHTHPSPVPHRLPPPPHPTPHPPTHTLALVFKRDLIFPIYLNRFNDPKRHKITALWWSTGRLLTATTPPLTHYRLNKLSNTIYWSTFSILGMSGYIMWIFLKKNGWTICKQWRPWSDAAFRGVLSGSALFASYPLRGLQSSMDYH